MVDSSFRSQVAGGRGRVATTSGTIRGRQTSGWRSQVWPPKRPLSGGICEVAPRLSRCSFAGPTGGPNYCDRSRSGVWGSTTTGWTVIDCCRRRSSCRGCRDMSEWRKRRRRGSEGSRRGTLSLSREEEGTASAIVALTSRSPVRICWLDLVGREVHSGSGRRHSLFRTPLPVAGGGRSMGLPLATPGRQADTGREILL